MAIRKILNKLRNSIYAYTLEANYEAFLNLLEKDTTAKVLDCGCGVGGFTQEIGKRIGTKDMWGTDIVERFNPLVEEKNIRFCLVDLNERLPFNDHEFDVVCSDQSIEHLYNIDMFIKEIWRILKPGGYAVVSTPNLASLHSILSLVLGFQPFTAYVSDEIRVGNPMWGDRRAKPIQSEKPGHTHLRNFPMRAFRELFQYHGFQIEKTVSIGWYPFTSGMARFMSKIASSYSAHLTIKVRKSNSGRYDYE